MERIMFASQVALNNVSKEISLAFENTLKSEGVDVLVAKNVVLYSSDKVDVTDEFVENLDKVIQSVAYPDPSKLGQ
jgi:Skp family chaperone for outer membrane proteins